jgi:Protein of unknown function (DUF3800)
MKFCYCDETGTGSEPFAVMVGVIVDSQRMHLTKEHWSELLNTLSATVGGKIEELHTRDFYAGNGVWRCLKGAKRAKIISDVCIWLAERKHRLVYTALNKPEFQKQLSAGKVPQELQTIWRFMGFHLMLAVQKSLQSQHGTKGNTVFIFDNESREEKKFANLIGSPPAWSDSY